MLNVIPSQRKLAWKSPSMMEIATSLGASQ